MPNIEQTQIKKRSEKVFTDLVEAIEFWNIANGAILEYFYGRYVVSYFEN